MILIVTALSGYLLGNISFSVIVSKYYFKKDIRTYGSRNAGTTNAARVFGLKFGIIVFVFDVLKGTIAVLIGRNLMPESGMYIAALSVVLGHNWPFFLGFKGGKGIATTIGAIFVINWQITVTGLIIGAAIAAVSKYMSLASVITMMTCPFLVIIIGEYDVKLFVLSVILTSLAIFRHKDNIRRLIKGEENKLTGR